MMLVILPPAEILFDDCPTVFQALHKAKPADTQRFESVCEYFQQDINGVLSIYRRCLTPFAIYVFEAPVLYSIIRPVPEIDRKV